MSFGGPTPSMTTPSGPFEATMGQIASSPYTIAAAIFLLNVGGRFLPMEITKEQEQFMNQPIFRRLIIFVIFFVATRNIITAIWLSLVMILCIGYLFNENSSLCLFGRGGRGTCKTKTAAQTLSLTPEEHNILRSLTDKSEKIKAASAGPIPLGSAKGVDTHDKYQKVIQGLWAN
jgi:hypothetical protein